MQNSPDTPLAPASENDHADKKPDAKANAKKPSTKKPARAPSNSRGPTPGKYQNGKVCFSTWFPTPFLVRLRRYATNLGTDVPSLIQSDYGQRLSQLHLTPEDVAEIELSNQSIHATKENAD